MTTYAKITDFASKDALLTGNPAKIVKGVEIDDEFNAIATADATSVKGPIGATVDNTVARWDGTTGRLVQGSGVSISDADVLTTPTLSVTGNTTLGDASTDTVTVNGYMGVGGAANSTIALNVASTALTGTNQVGAQFTPTGTSAATSSVRGVYARGDTAAAAFTAGYSAAFFAANPTKGAGSTITDLHGLYIADQTQGTNNYGITSLVSSGTNKWNIYASGTAANYFAGNVGIGTTSPSSFTGSGVKMVVGSAATTTTNATLTVYSGNATYGGLYFADGTVGNEAYRGYVEYKHDVDALALASAGVERIRIDSAGNTLNVSTGGLGYGTGSGGTVTQATSRTTGVTLNKTNGAITMFTAAGSATATSFTVTNSSVAATDTIVVSVKSGTNKYLAFVTAVAAGSFEITFQTTGGTASDAPVINFAVLKAVTA